MSVTSVSIPVANPHPDTLSPLALVHIPAARRHAVTTLMGLDQTLGGIVRHTREPMVGQMRLTWWHNALTALDNLPPPAQPVLERLATQILPHNIHGATLAGMIDGWETLLDGPALDTDALARFATQRGAGLFTAVAQVLGAEGNSTVTAAGEGWALADLASRLSDGDAAMRARAMAETRLAAAFAERWPRVLRPLGVIALVAQAELTGHPAPSSPALALRLIRHRLTGR